jgi:hypothetical protein
MTASDHLSKSQFRLFHGTNVDIPKGEHITPGDASENDVIDEETGKHIFDTPRSRYGDDLAFASSNPAEAASYGANVYEVKANENDRDLENHGDGIYGHPQGFEIKRQVPSKVVERYKSIVGPMHKAKYEASHQRTLAWLKEHEENYKRENPHLFKN